MSTSWSKRRKKGDYSKVSSNSGHYKLYHGNRVVYAGESKNVKRRIQQHEKNMKGWGSYQWNSSKGTSKRERKKTEKRIIKRSKPTRNKKHT